MGTFGSQFFINPQYTGNNATYVIGIVGTRLFSIRDSFLYVTDATTVYARKLVDGTAVATGTTSFTFGSAPTFISDILIIDDVLCLIWIDPIADHFSTIVLLPDGSFGTVSTINLATNSYNHIYPGITKHPILPIVYAGTTATNLVSLQVFKVSNVAAPTVLTTYDVTIDTPNINFVRHRPRFMDGVLQLLIQKTSNMQPVLLTLRTNNFDPAELTLVANNILAPSVFGPVNAQFVSTPTGHFVFSYNGTFQKQLTLIGPDVSNQVYVTSKDVSSNSPANFCQHVGKKSEAPTGPEYCAPSNAMYVLFDADGCECRTIMQPAGTSLPCVTLSVMPGALKTSLNGDIIPLGDIATNINIFPGAVNPYGCEFYATHSTGSITGSMRYIRFVIDQNCNVLDPLTGGALSYVTTSLLGLSGSIQDLHCVSGDTYLLTDKTLHKATAGVFAANLLPGSPSGLTCFAGSNGKIIVGNNVVGTQVIMVQYQLSPFAFATQSAPVANYIVSDVSYSVEGLFAVAIYNSTSSLATDAVYVIDASTGLATTSLNLPNTFSGLVTDYQGGMVRHPSANVFYIASTSFANTAIILSIVTVNSTATVATLKAQLMLPVDIVVPGFCVSPNCNKASTPLFSRSYTLAFCDELTARLT